MDDWQPMAHDDWEPVAPRVATKSDLAMQSVSDPETSVPARLTAYGANAISQIPGLKELGSAGAAYLGHGHGNSFGERYNDLEESQKAMRHAGQQVDPTATTIGDISSNVLGLGLAGKLGGYAGNALDTVAPGATAAAGTFAKAHPYVASVAAGVPTGAVYGFANGDDAASRTSGAALGAAAGAVAGPALTAAGRNIVEPAIGKLAEIAGAPVAQKAAQAVPKTAEEMRAAASAAYPDSQKVILNSQASQDAATGVEGSLLQGGKLNARLHGDTMSILQDMKDDAAKGSLSLRDLHQYRQLFGQAVNNNLHPNGNMKPDAMMANKAIDAIDDTIENAAKDPSKLSGGSPADIAQWQKAQTMWSQAARMDEIERIIERAKLTDNAATSMRTGFRNLYMNRKRMRGFTDDQADLIKTAAQSSLPVEAMRTLGSRLLNVAGVASGHPVAAAAAQLGTAGARSLAGKMQESRGQKILEAIADPGGLNAPQLGTNPVPAAIAGGAAAGFLPNQQKSGGRIESEASRKARELYKKRKKAA